jgi:hypothetical protein
MMKRPRIFIAWAIPAVFLIALGTAVLCHPDNVWASETQLSRVMDPRSGDPTEPGNTHELPLDDPWISTRDFPKQQYFRADATSRLSPWRIWLIRFFAFGF